VKVAADVAARFGVLEAHDDDFAARLDVLEAHDAGMQGWNVAAAPFVPAARDAVLEA